MSIAEPPDMTPLDDATRTAAVDAVAAAKARGWSQEALRAWFGDQGVAFEDYRTARNGGAVSPGVRGVLAMISITGLPERPVVAGATAASATDDTFEDPFPDLPAAMKAARRWMLWKSEPNADPTKKPRKVPYYVDGDRRQGALDTPEDTARLTSYFEACVALSLTSGAFTGLGFALGPDGDGAWQGIDLDNLDQHPGLQFIAEDLPGYTERSPSGGGVHAIGYGRAFASLGSNATGIEAYASGRYFTVTGESTGQGDPVCLADFVERRLAPLHRPQPQDTSAAAQAAAGSLLGAFAVHDLRSALTSLRADDRDLWIRLGHALKSLGDQGRGLWLEWSQTSPKYDAADASRVWDSFKPERTGYQAVFAEAQRSGWVNPATGRLAVGIPTTVERVDPETGEVTREPQGDDLFEVLSIADLRALPDAEWMVDKAIPRQALGFIYGPPGSYKSFICGDLGLALAYGQPTWIDRAVKHPGSVLYIANEGAAGLKNRITAWQIKNGHEGDDTDRFRLIRKSMSFMDAKDIDRLDRTVAAEVEARGAVDTVFVDTVSRVLPGADENMQKDMTVFVAACDRLRERFGATVIGVHHTNKQGDMRGSTVFLGQGDFVYRVERDEGQKSGVLTCEKQKEAEDGWKIAFSMESQEWTPEGRIEPVSSLTVTYGGEPATDLSWPVWPSKDVCRAMLRDIDAAWVKGRPWSPYPRAGTEGRYATRNLCQAFDLKPELVEAMLEAWQKNDVLGFEVHDKTTKQRGLRVLQWLD